MGFLGLVNSFRALFEREPEIPPLREVPRYPPWEDGLPVVPPEQLMESQSEILRVVRESLAVTPDFWETVVSPMLIRLASYVQLLPASEPGQPRSHHVEAGGLFHHSLETCRWALHFSTNENPYQNPMLNMDSASRAARFDRWRVGVAVAALCHDIGKPITDTRVVSLETGERWRPNRGSMYQWAKRTGTRNIGLEWVANRYQMHTNVSTRYHELIIGDEVQDWIADVDETLWQDVLRSSTGDGIEGRSKIYHLIAQADRRSTELDIAERERQRESTSPLTPVSKIVQDIMLSLAHSHESWSAPNTNGSRVWVTWHGIFLTKKALEDIAMVVRERNIPTLIDSPDVIANRLLEAGYIEPSDPDADRIYWRVAPVVLRRPDGHWVELDMMKIQNPVHLFGQSDVPPPIEAQVAKPGGRPLPPPGSSFAASSGERNLHRSEIDTSDQASGLPTTPTEETRDPEEPPPITEADIPPQQEADLNGSQDESAEFTENHQNTPSVGDKRESVVSENEWTQAGLAEAVKQCPGLFDVLTNANQFALIANVSYGDNIYLRMSELQTALAYDTPKQMITVLAGAGIIEPALGLAYAHDIGESGKALLLKPSKFKKYHEFFNALCARGVDALSESHRSALASSSDGPADRRVTQEKRVSPDTVKRITRGNPSGEKRPRAVQAGAVPPARTRPATPHSGNTPKPAKQVLANGQNDETAKPAETIRKPAKKTEEDFLKRKAEVDAMKKRGADDRLRHHQSLIDYALSMKTPNGSFYLVEFSEAGLRPDIRLSRELKEYFREKGYVLDGKRLKIPVESST